MPRRRIETHSDTRGFNIVSNSETNGPVAPAPTNRMPTPTTLPRTSDTSFREDDFFLYMNNRDSAGDTIAQIDTSSPQKAAEERQPLDNSSFNLGRQRMLEATYSKHWDLKHPGTAAGSAVATTASDYAAHSVGPARPNITPQDMLASTMTMSHPTPTAKENSEFPLKPQQTAPSIAESQSMQFAGQSRSNLSEHWTRHYDMSLRGGDALRLEKAQQIESGKVAVSPLDQTARVPSLPEPLAPLFPPPVASLAMDPGYPGVPLSPFVVPAMPAVMASGAADGVLSTLRHQLLRISESRS